MIWLILLDFLEFLAICRSRPFFFLDRQASWPSWISPFFFFSTAFVYQLVFQLLSSCLCPCFSSCLCACISSCFSSCLCACISSCFSSCLCSCTVNLFGSRVHFTPKRLAAALTSCWSYDPPLSIFFNRSRTILLAPLVKPAREL